MARSNRPGLSRLASLAAILACAAATAVAAKTEVPLFLFSGQSNMVGLGTNSSDLSTAQKAFFPDTNIKVYLDAEGATTYMKKWSNLAAVFGGATAGQGFGPELFFGKVLNDTFPGRKFAFIKDARSGTYLGKATEWLPPSSNNGTGGTYYTAMMGSIDAALKSFNTAFDTAKYAPRWAGFIWLQGEFDAMDAGLSNSYETNLENLIKDIRAKAAVTDLPVILPMIDAQTTWTNYAKIWKADIAMTTKLTHVDTVSTKGLPTDNIHYKAAGMVTIGERCAARYLRMKTLTTSILDPVPTSPAVLARYPLSSAVRFDLLGRRLGSSSSHAALLGAPSLVQDHGKDLQPSYSVQNR